MNGFDLLPALDPTPNPGPVWLFQVLLVFTWVLHALFMNLTLGGTLMAAVAQLASRGREGDHRTALAARMSTINSYGIAFTITTGIAPLLFVQVIYHQTFYAATILIGGAWLGMLGLLMVGYYSAYLYKFRGAPTHGSGGTFWLVLSALLFLGIAMIQVAVNLIHSQPGEWLDVAANGWAALGDPTYVPRLLHFVLGGIALTAGLVSWWAVRKARQGEEVDLNESIARHAWKWAMGAIFLQVPDGFLFLMLLPRDVLSGVMSNVWVVAPFAVGVLLALGLLMMLARIPNPVEKPGAVNGVLGAMVLTLAVMAITRHQVRMLYLEPFTTDLEWVMAPQWGNFVLFALLLVVALATVGWMVREVNRSQAAGDEAA